jgi:signal transduction histidine kinase
MTLAPRWLRARAGVRAASALSAAAVVALALVVAGVALILLVGQSLSRSVQTDAVQKAEAIADRMHGNYGKRVNGNYTPKENAVEALDTLMGQGDPALAQIIVDYSDDQDGSGWALQEGSDNGSLGPMSDIAPGTRENIVVPSAYVPDRAGTMHAVLVAVGGTTTTTDPMHFVVLYAAPLAAVDAAQDTVMFYLLFGVPILIVIAGAATYFFAGRALRPVEAIRARVASMSEKDLAERVPVPAARDEVGRLAETMNGMIARLEQAQKVQRRFVADASHELRSPLATIGAGLELLQDSDPGTVRALRGETERLGRLVDDLLLLARADERGLQPRRDEVDLDEIVEAERARPTEDGVRTEVRAEHVRVVGDRGQLVRVLRNLVDNAHRHARSQVLVTLGREGDQAAIDVADDGPGVPADDRIRIFERFVRLDDARARADGGSGLGLAIVAEVVSAHDGRVWVESAAGGGALFRVRLPAAELPVEVEDDDADLPVATTAEPTIAAPTAGSTEPTRPAAAATIRATSAAVGAAALASGATNDRATASATPSAAADHRVGTNGVTANTIAANGTAADGASPHATAAHATAANGTTANEIGPDGTAVDATGPHATPATANGLHVAAATAAGPHATGPNEAAPTGAPPDGATHDDATQIGAAPNQATPNQTAPNQTAPNQTAPDDVTPDDAPPSRLRPRRARRGALRRPPIAQPLSDDPYADWVPPQPPSPAPANGRGR